jgi:hypothetical protein
LYKWKNIIPKIIILKYKQYNADVLGRKRRKLELCDKCHVKNHVENQKKSREIANDAYIRYSKIKITKIIFKFHFTKIIIGILNYNRYRYYSQKTSSFLGATYSIQQYVFGLLSKFFY